LKNKNTRLETQFYAQRPSIRLDFAHCMNVEVVAYAINLHTCLFVFTFSSYYLAILNPTLLVIISKISLFFIFLYFFGIKWKGIFEI